MKRKLDLLSRVVAFILLVCITVAMFRLSSAVRSLKPAASSDGDTVIVQTPLDLREDIVNKVLAREPVEDQYMLLVDEATASKLERYNYCTSKLHNDFMRFAVQAVYNQLYPEVAYVPNAQSANDLYANERQMAAKIAHYALYRRPAEYIRLDDTLALLTCALDESGPSGSWLDAIHENVEMPLNMESMDQYFTLCDDIVSALK